MSIKKCVYCLESKEESLFNREHVIPQSLGTFHDSLVLTGYVCKSCNNKFSSFEIKLGRDSLYGTILRCRSGIIKNNYLIKNKHKRELHYSYVIDRDFGALLVDPVGRNIVKKNQINIMIADQVRVMNSTKGIIKNFFIDDERLLHPEFMDSIGLFPKAEYINIMLQPNINHDKINKVCNIVNKLSKNESNKKLRFNDVIFKRESTDLYVKSNITIEIERVIAKIAFNLFIAEYGKISYNECFNKVRNFVVGTKNSGVDFELSTNKYTFIDEDYVTDNGHFIIVKKVSRSKDIYVYISLFGVLQCRVKLSDSFNVEIYDVGYFFDLDTRKIYKYNGSIYRNHFLVTE